MKIPKHLDEIKKLTFESSSEKKLNKTASGRNDRKNETKNCVLNLNKW